MKGIFEALDLLEDLNAGKVETCPKCDGAIRVTICTGVDDPKAKTSCFRCGYVFGGDDEPTPPG